MKNTTSAASRARRIVLPILALWLASALSLRGALPSAEKWYVITIADSPVGYVHDISSRLPAPAAPLLFYSSEMKMVLNRLGTKVEMRFLTTFEETGNAELRKVGYEMQASVLSTKTEAVVEARRIVLRSESGGKTYSRTVEYDGTLVGQEGIRLLSARNLKNTGDQIEFQTFVPELEGVSKGRRRVLARETLHLVGKDIPTLKVEEYLEAGAVLSTAWLDADYEVVRQEMPTPFGTGVFVLADKAQALAAAESGALPPEMFERSIIRSNVRLPKARDIAYLKLKLIRKNAEPGWAEISLPSETVLSKDEKALVVEVRRPAAPKPSPFPAAADTDMEYLEPNAYIQSDEAGIRAMARDIVGGEKDAFRATLKLERWVADSMTFDLGIALAPSSEIFHNRRGTCLGYATLLAALTRAVGIPSRVIVGYVYALGIFGGHAWTEIRVDGSWVPVDAAIPAANVADAARLGVVATSFRDGAGLLNGGAALKIFGQVDLKVLAFAIGNEDKIPVAEDTQPYRVMGNSYENAALGLAFQKPAKARFTKLDAVWPETTLVAWESPDGERGEIREAYLKPWVSDEDAAAAVFGSVGIRAKPERVRRLGRDGFQAASGSQAMLILFDRPGAWVVIAEGREPSQALERAIATLKVKPTGR